MNYQAPQTETNSLLREELRALWKAVHHAPLWRGDAIEAARELLRSAPCG